MGRKYDSRVMKPQKITDEGVLFDSLFEHSVYRHIRLVYPQEFIVVHGSLPVLPATLHFPALFWKCDFELKLPWRADSIFIEAKGVATQEFKIMLQCLAYTSPATIENLIIVNSEAGKRLGKSLKTVNVTMLTDIMHKLKHG